MCIAKREYSRQNACKKYLCINLVISKDKKIYLQNEKQRWGWVNRFDFYIEVHSRGEGGSTTSQHLQYFFM